MRARVLTVVSSLSLAFVSIAPTAATEHEAAPDPAHWHPVQAAAAAAFHPSPTSISSSGRANLLGKQYSTMSPAAGSPDRKTVPVLAPDLFGATNAVHDAWATPVVQRAAVLVATVNARGELESISVETSSGDRRFDHDAADALQRAIVEHPVDEGVRRVTRWRIAATRAVQPLRVHPVIPARTRPTGIVGQMSFKFDESHGSVDAQNPLADAVKTNVELLSLTAARASSDGGIP
jgi:TonB family protein